jgi:hypothetical protein
LIAWWEKSGDTSPLAPTVSAREAAADQSIVGKWAQVAAVRCRQWDGTNLI